ncbi:hypothetical protein ACHQM5_030351 [Ranunculus cassubicifolius]
MAKKICSRRELLDRWRGIEEEDDSVWSDPTKQNRLRKLKEQWFSDTFNFLICLQEHTHIWCGSWDLMGFLLETFYNYFKDVRDDSPLKILWRRISLEMRQCTQCICQHHQAQEMYSTEYELSCVGPLLNVLRVLDEERVTQHLKEINARVAHGEVESEGHAAEVVSVMFEVLMFPVLLDDQSLVTEFQIFIEAVDDTHELTLAGHQQYPGVYALLFLKSRRVRTIGLRLACANGKLRRAADLEPLQPLLKKCIGYLETEILPSAMETSRPRVQLERVNVWHGIKALLGFLEPHAFEEGILERYPIFLTIVLNHVSDDSLEFSHAVNCLRLILEMLGCKLWLRTTLSPSVMRNTLLGQCFHTRNEKSHKEIFDLFQPFLQSLEALQDGEHEKQRRHFLYFLLHQVKMSSNFSVLMRKKACQIAILIIHRGYKMDPPCPPFECAHMWGPSLICSLRDSSLHDSLRQPAFDLIHTIIVSDSAALVACSMTVDLNDDEDELPFFHDVEEKDSSCWSEFSFQNKLTTKDCRDWMCVPMLWFDVLVETNISVFPISFSKAVLWALSRFSMIELESSIEMDLSVRDWLSSYAGNISFTWEVPTGSDDGGAGKVSKNSIKTSAMFIPLVKTFKRMTSQFVIQMENGELWKQWTWEPRMAESLILLLVDPNDNVRQVDRLIVEHVSKTKGLASGLQFLCSCASSLSALYMGLRHALRLVQLDSVLSNFHKLHHFFFVLGKLLKEMATPLTSQNEVNGTKFSSQGGFLRQPVFNASIIDLTDSQSMLDPKSLERFSHSLSELSWPSLVKCLAEGKRFINNKSSQMACVRLLEILPIVAERLCSPLLNVPGTEFSIFELKWLHDLVDWGKSSQATVSRYWKQSFSQLLDVLRSLCPNGSASRFGTIELLMSRDDTSIDELKEQISQLSVLFSNEVVGSPLSKAKTVYDGFAVHRGISSPKTGPSFFEPVVHLLDSPALVKKKSLAPAVAQLRDSPAVVKSTKKEPVLVLSDDEAEEKLTSKLTNLSSNAIIDLMNESTVESAADKGSVVTDTPAKELKQGIENEPWEVALKAARHSQSLQKNSEPSSDNFGAVGASRNLGTAAVIKDLKQDIENEPWEVALKSEKRSQSLQKKSEPSSVNFGAAGASGNLGIANTVIKDLKQDIEDEPWEVALKAAKRSQSLQKNSERSSERTKPGMMDVLLKDSAQDIENDPWERALNAARNPQPLHTKLGPSAPKRQVIQLNMPGENRAGYLRRSDTEGKRLKLPRLDDWYRPILELDYFSAVGLSSANEDESETATAINLKEVPVCFHSPDHYVDIFRPLVLEEFKAQLHNSFLESSSPEEMCCGSISVLSVERVDDFHLIRCSSTDDDPEASKGCTENDLVLLTKNPLKNHPHDVHMIGKMERREKDYKRRLSILVIRFYFQSGSSRLNKAKRFLIERSKWHLNRIMSMTPQLREFQALSSLKDIPILPIILKPTSHSFRDSRIELGNLSQPLQHTLKSSFNDSQLQAISIAIRTHGLNSDFELSLIQGPPGTGKTRTILAIVSGLLALPSQRRRDADTKESSSLKPNNSAFSSNSRSQISQSAAIARAWQDAAVARQLNKDEREHSELVENATRARVLICAQSNAAVDELVSRISCEGLYGTDGKPCKPYLVRVGNRKTVHPSSLPFFIDTLVDQRLAEEKMIDNIAKDDLGGDTSMLLRSNLEKLVDRIRFYEAKRAKIRDGNTDSKSSSENSESKENGATKEDDDERDMSDAAVGAMLNKLYDQKREISKDLFLAQTREKKTSEEIKALKIKLRKTILREAQIVVTTLSGSGGDLYGVCSESFSNYKFGSFSENTLFDAVVIDEAAQALEPATLIPLQLLKSSRTKCIMVGDPKQLPATVLSQVASKFLYECSMFERLQRAGHPVVMLAKQYRMHPEICKFPSYHFYENKLLNGGQMTSKNAPFHESKYLGPYLFFDVVDGQESHGKKAGSMSLFNECEASVAVEVLRFFSQKYPSEFVGGRIGIISPYKSQVSLLRSKFSSVFGSGVTADVEFNTVDGFQGREVDILILSTVRASDLSVSGGKSSVIGFVADVRRMNVALTRAKLSLWILGNAKTLQTNQNWAALIKNAKERNLIKTMMKPYASMFKKSSSGGLAKETVARKPNSGTKPVPLNKGEGPSKNINPPKKMKSSPIVQGTEIDRKLPESVKSDVESKNTPSPNTLNDTGECSEHGTKESKLIEGEGTDGSMPADPITTRKRQRAAVDALLSSALLPSKKPSNISKTKSVKRPISPTASADPNKPPKPIEEKKRENFKISEIISVFCRY